ncbi:hypothetical protein ACETU7_18160 [Rhodococcus sp. 3Y1]
MGRREGPGSFVTGEDRGEEEKKQRPSFAATRSDPPPGCSHAGQSICRRDRTRFRGTPKSVLDFLGTPVVALGLAVLVGMVLLGRGGGMDRKAISKSLESSLPPIAGILLIVGAGGGFKQVLIDTGIAG